MRYSDMWSRMRNEKSNGLLSTDLGVLPKIRIRLNYGNVDRYNVLQFATTTVFSIRQFPKGNMVVAEAPPKVWERGSDSEMFQ